MYLQKTVKQPYICLLTTRGIINIYSFLLISYLRFYNQLGPRVIESRHTLQTPPPKLVNWWKRACAALKIVVDTDLIILHWCLLVLYDLYWENGNGFYQQIASGFKTFELNGLLDLMRETKERAYLRCLYLIERIQDIESLLFKSTTNQFHSNICCYDSEGHQQQYEGVIIV